MAEEQSGDARGSFAGRLAGRRTVAKRRTLPPSACSDSGDPATKCAARDARNGSARYSSTSSSRGQVRQPLGEPALDPRVGTATTSAAIGSPSGSRSRSPSASTRQSARSERWTVSTSRIGSQATERVCHPRGKPKRRRIGRLGTSGTPRRAPPPGHPLPGTPAGNPLPAPPACPRLRLSELSGAPESPEGLSGPQVAVTSERA